MIEIGGGVKLPANVVVVATGNYQKDSSIAEEPPLPLEKRFDHVLDMEPRVKEWLTEYAIPHKLHPAVIGYIYSKYLENRQSEALDKISYFYEDSEVGENNLDQNGQRGKTNDPRTWNSVSETLYLYEKDLREGKFVGILLNSIVVQN